LRGSERREEWRTPFGDAHEIVKSPAAVHLDVGGVSVRRTA
jgi:hypothetical protein